MAEADEKEEAKGSFLESTSTSYQELVTKLREMKQLERASCVIAYDEMVFMPHSAKAAETRGAIKSALESVIHEKSVSAEMESLLTQATADAEGKKDEDLRYERRVLQMARKSYDKKVKLSRELVEKRAALKSRAYASWAKARGESDFETFSPVLKECFDITHEVASQLRASEDIPIYTELLDEYEVGMSPDRIDEMFNQVRQELVPLLEKVLASSVEIADDFFKLDDTNKDSISIEKQKELSRKVIKELGYNDTNGRVDVSVHPFTMPVSSPHDVRITSRFNDDKEWYSGLLASVHEAGHAMYEQNLKDSSLPVDTALSMGMHESQSLFWERHVGKCRPFWTWAAPLVNESFQTDLSPDQLYAAVNKVKPGFIRVEADELTYPLHVILRYGIERDVVDGKLEVKDIPTRWNAEMDSMLKVQVPDDAKGCLQDIHWSLLSIGYFPTYLIGAICSAQLMHYCKLDLGEEVVESNIAKGQFVEIKQWLTEKVHKHGSLYTSMDEHLTAQIGEPLNPKYYIDYLKKKYGELYQI